MREPIAGRQESIVATREPIGGTCRAIEASIPVIAEPWERRAVPVRSSVAPRAASTAVRTWGSIAADPGTATSAAIAGIEETSAAEIAEASAADPGAAVEAASAAEVAEALVVADAGAAVEAGAAAAEAADS